MGCISKFTRKCIFIQFTNLCIYHSCICVHIKVPVGLMGRLSISARGISFGPIVVIFTVEAAKIADVSRTIWKKLPAFLENKAFFNQIKPFFLPLSLGLLFTVIISYPARNLLTNYLEITRRDNNM